MTNEINNSEDFIDSLDVIARIEELEDIRDTEDHEAVELDVLRALADQASDYAEDWEYGETLIRDTYFKTYAMELADDIGAINSEAGWPINYIDWDQATRELQLDYISLDFNGVTYWIR